MWRVKWCSMLFFAEIFRILSCKILPVFHDDKHIKKIKGGEDVINQKCLQQRTAWMSKISILQIPLQKQFTSFLDSVPLLCEDQSVHGAQGLGLHACFPSSQQCYSYAIDCSGYSTQNVFFTLRQQQNKPSPIQPVKSNPVC